MALVKCEVVIDEDGMMTFSSSGKKVALVLPSGKVVDLRCDPPFNAMYPCPWCARKHGLNSKGADHDPLCHIDPSLGVSNEV